MTPLALMMAIAGRVPLNDRPPLSVKQYINQHINYAGRSGYRLPASVKGQRTVTLDSDTQCTVPLFGQINCLTNFTDNIRARRRQLLPVEAKRKCPGAVGIRVAGMPGPEYQAGRQSASHVTGSRSLFRTFVAAAAEISQQGAARSSKEQEQQHATRATAEVESGRYSAASVITIMPQQR